jgi:hypothetical protein
MIMCDADFRPWHGELIIYCRDNVFYNRANPLEVQKNMKCKAAACDHEKYGIACFNHPDNRNRREAEFSQALERSSRAVEEVGGDRASYSKWSGSGSRRCSVNCHDGYENQGSNVAVCDLKSGVWNLLPGTCEEIHEEKGIGCVAPQNLDNGKWNCKLTDNESSMRGDEFDDITDEEAEEFNLYNTEQMSMVADRGMWELVPGFDARKRREVVSDSKWSQQLGRFASEKYLVCQMNCKEGFQPKNDNLNKIGCRMSDANWLKKFQKTTHVW